MATNHLVTPRSSPHRGRCCTRSASRVDLVASTQARGGQLSPQTTREQLPNPALYDGRQVYRSTTQANLLFAQELPRRSANAGSPVSAVAVHRAQRDEPVRAPARAGPIAACRPLSARS